jgi:hypothetical protein
MAGIDPCQGVLNGAAHWLSSCMNNSENSGEYCSALGGPMLNVSVDCSTH